VLFLIINVIGSTVQITLSCLIKLKYICIVASIFLLSNFSYALDSSFNYRLGVRYTDNSLLTEKNKKNELSLNALVGFAVADGFPNLIYSVNGSVNRTKYTNDTFAETTFYRLIGDLVWDIVPASFSWQVNNNLSVQEVDQLNRPLPTNKQQINIFSTGPSIIYRLNSINRLLIDYRFSDIKYEKKILITNVDNQREIYKAAIEHRISDGSSISLNYDVTAVNYIDDDVNNDFTGRTTYLLYNAVKARSTINLSAGVNKASLKTNSKVFESSFYSLNWDYQINNTSNLSSRYWRGLSDVTNDVSLSNYLNSGVVNVADLNDSTIFTVERLNLLYTQNTANLQTSYSLYGIEQDYAEVRPRQLTLGATITVNYNITRPLILISSLTQVSRRTMAVIEQKTLDKSASIGLRYFVSPKMQLITRYTRNNRISNLARAMYEENIISLSLTYTNAPRENRLR